MNDLAEPGLSPAQDDGPSIRHDFIVTLSGYGRGPEEAFEDAFKAIQDAPPYYDHYTFDRSDVAE